MNYTSLTAAKTSAGSIKSWLGYSRIDVDAILEEAQHAIFRMLRVREMRATAALALNAGDSSVALPDGFIDSIGRVTDTSDYRYKRVSQEALAELRTYTAGVLNSGQPTVYSVHDELLNFDKKFSSGRTLTLNYFKMPTFVSASNPSNFLCTNYPQILRHACLALAEDFRNNETAYNRHIALLTKLIEQANGVDADPVFDEAQSLIFQTLRVREMRATATLNLSTGDSYVALPTGFLDPIGRLSDTNNGRYTQIPADRMKERRTYTSGTLDSGTPAYWSIHDERINFDKRFAAGRTLELAYYKKPQLLSASDDSNFLSARYPEILQQALLTVGARKEPDTYRKHLELVQKLISDANVEVDPTLEDAQALIFQMLRVREMRTSYQFTASVGDSAVALPTGFLDPLGPITDTDGNSYVQVLPERLRDARFYQADVLTSGTPRCWAIIDDQITFDCKFDQERTLILDYYEKPELTSASDLSNFLVSRYPHILRRAQTALAEINRNPAAYQQHVALLQQLIERANAESDLSLRGADFDTEV